MQRLNQPLAIAVTAGVVLFGGVAELVGRDGGTDVTVGDERGDVTGTDTDPGDGTATDGATGAGTDGSATEGSTGDGSGGDGSGTDGTGTDGTGGTGSEDGDVADGGGTAVADPQPIAALSAPAAGTYLYDSSGTWQLTGDVAHTLPDTSEATVAASSDGWMMRVSAGNDFVDTYGFRLDADGLDWTDWSLDRVFFGAGSTTVYACSSEEPFHTADNTAGRSIAHGCVGPQGLTSAGPVRTVGVETLTLSEGGSAETVHLRYDYEVGSPDCEGEGTLDLWLDRATGMRVQEIRTIRSTCTDDAGVATTYDESVRFTLRSTTPA